MTTTISTLLWGNLISLEVDYDRDTCPGVEKETPPVDEVTINHITIPCGFSFPVSGKLESKIWDKLLEKIKE